MRYFYKFAALAKLFERVGLDGRITAALAKSALTKRVAGSAPDAARVAVGSLKARLASRSHRAPVKAIHLATITSAAQEHLAPAAGAQEQAYRLGHRRNPADERWT